MKNIMTRAHQLARGMEGDYRARLALALRMAWKEYKKGVDEVKKVDLSKLRKVRLEWTPSGARFVTTDIEPLVEGEMVKFDPENTEWYGKPFDESRAVVGIVGKVLHIGEPYKALGEGETYAEQVANARMVRYQVAEVGQAQVKVSDLMARAIAANCR